MTSGLSKYIPMDAAWREGNTIYISPDQVDEALAYTITRRFQARTIDGNLTVNARRLDDLVELFNERHQPTLDAIAAAKDARFAAMTGDRIAIPDLPYPDGYELLTAAKDLGARCIERVATGEKVWAVPTERAAELQALVDAALERHAAAELKKTDPRGVIAKTGRATIGKVHDRVVFLTEHGDRAAATRRAPKAGSIIRDKDGSLYLVLKRHAVRHASETTASDFGVRQGWQTTVTAIEVEPNDADHAAEALEATMLNAYHELTAIARDAAERGEAQGDTEYVTRHTDYPGRATFTSGNDIIGRTLVSNGDTVILQTRALDHMWTERILTDPAVGAALRRLATLPWKEAVKAGRKMSWTFSPALTGRQLAARNAKLSDLTGGSK
jgi:hypothetical protein